MSSARTTATARGFTLIELLVAIFIAAIIFALGYGGVSQGLREREALAASERRLTAVQTTVRLLVQDFSQLAQRPIRDPLGTTTLGTLVSNSQASSSSFAGLANTSSTRGAAPAAASPSSASSTSLGASDAASALVANGSSGPTNDQTPAFVTFTRMGWANPAGIQRPALERVQYVISHGSLLRENFRVLDPTLDDQPVVRKLLDHVKSVKLRYLDQARAWHDDWPVPTSVTGSASATLRQRPVAIEVTLELEDYGTLTRLIEVPG
jgi:type II secretion system protein J